LIQAAESLVACLSERSRLERSVAFIVQKPMKVIIQSNVGPGRVTGPECFEDGPVSRDVPKFWGVGGRN